jgi:protein gp37
MQFLKNLWVGTRLTKADTNNQIFDLLQTPAAGHFVYCHPSEFVSLDCIATENCVVYNAFTGKCIEALIGKEDACQTRYKLEWVIVGEGELGIDYFSSPMYPAWISALQFPAEQHNTPFYYTGSRWVSSTKAEAEKNIDFFGNIPSQHPAQTCYLKRSKKIETRLKNVHYKELPFAV